MNKLKVFSNDNFGEVRTLVIDNAPYFIGKDIASALGYKDTSDALKKHVDREDKMTLQIADSLGRKQNTYAINESGLYSLILSSKLPTAKKFKRWVTDEVLPTIRKEGAYITNKVNPQKLRDKADELESLKIAYNSSTMLNQLMESVGLDAQAKLLTAKALYQKAGVNLPIQIKEEARYYDTKQIAKELNIKSRKGRPAYNAVGQIIKRIDIPDNERQIVWESTGSWQGTVIKYSESVIDRVKKWLEDNDYPTKITYITNNGKSRTYYVVYAEKEGIVC